MNSWLRALFCLLCCLWVTIGYSDPKIRRQAAMLRPDESARLVFVPPARGYSSYCSGIRCVGIPSKQTLWEFRLPVGLSSCWNYPQWADGDVLWYAGGDNRRSQLLRINGTTGKLRWRVDLPKTKARSGPPDLQTLFLKDVVAVEDRTGAFLFFRWSDGKALRPLRLARYKSRTPPARVENKRLICTNSAKEEISLDYRAWLDTSKGNPVSTEIKRIQSLRDRGKNAQAISAIDALVERVPYQPDLWALRSSVYRQAGDMQSADWSQTLAMIFNKHQGAVQDEEFVQRTGLIGVYALGSHVSLPIRWKRFVTVSDSHGNWMGLDLYRWKFVRLGRSRQSVALGGFRPWKDNPEHGFSMSVGGTPHRELQEYYFPGYLNGISYTYEQHTVRPRSDDGTKIYLFARSRVDGKYRGITEANVGGDECVERFIESPFLKAHDGGHPGFAYTSAGLVAFGKGGIFTVGKDFLPTGYALKLPQNNDPKAPQHIWRMRATRTTWGCLLANENGDHFLHVYDRKTGELLRQAKLARPRVWYSSTHFEMLSHGYVQFNGNMVFLPASKGKGVFRFGPNNKRIQTVTRAEVPHGNNEWFSKPVIHRNHLYVTLKDYGTLLVFDTSVFHQVASKGDSPRDELEKGEKLRNKRFQARP